MSTDRLVLLSGGVGGAKLVEGFSRLEDVEALAVANTGDDFEHLGLKICPDIDSILYALAGINDSERGWGLAGESWQALQSIGALGGDTWFQLGDKDLATHILRSHRLRSGDSLSVVTQQFCEALGGGCRLVPMTDDAVSTRVHTETETLAFQEYFVRDACEPAVTGFEFSGVESARPNRQWLQWMASSELLAIVICPSNPFVSVDPMLSLPGVRDALRSAKAPVIAVSPIVGGRAIKGPAAKMMAELGVPSTAQGVMQYYGDLLSGFVLESGDHDGWDADVPCLETQTVMGSADDRQRLAAQIVSFARSLGK